MTSTSQNSSSEQKLAAIMFTDIVGYTSMMETDEAKALDVLRKSREIQKNLIAKYTGKWVKEMGDGVLAEFSSAYKAVCCAVDIQDEAKNLLDCKIRIGIHLGEVTVENDDIFGDGVNIASRIQSIAEPGGIFVSESIKKAVHSKADIELGYLGKINLKNVAEPISTFYLKKEFLTVPSKQRTRDLQVRKNRLPLILSILVPILLVLLYVFVIRDSGNTTAKAKTIDLLAILPFSNNNPDPETDYLGFAIANQVIGDLSYINNISVRPASSIRKYVGQTIDPLVAGDDLNVDYVVMGNYLREGNSIRVAVELLEVKTNELIWREPIELDFSSAFELQDIVAQKVINVLNVQLSSTELDRISKDIPANPLAYEYYLRSLSYPLTNEGHQLAIDMLNKSVEIDSSYAPTYVQLGARNHHLAQYSVRGNDKFQVSENYYLKALSLNEELIGALARMTSLYTETGRIEKAVRATKDLLEVNPNSAEAHYTLGYIYRYAGMNEEAVSEMELAVNLDSTNQRFRSIMITYFTAGYYEKAIKAYDNYEENPFTLYCLGLSYLRNNERSLAARTFTKGIELDPQDLLSYDSRCLKYFIEGDIDRAMDEARELEKFISGDSEVWFSLAGYYSLLGERNGSIRALRKAVEGGYFNYPFFNSDPFLESVRNDPEFKEILALAKDKHDAFKGKFVDK